MLSLNHPVWLVGFRPFFSLAMLAGMLLPSLWVLILNGALPAPPAAVPALQWHAHEMFFGFGWAVLGGFLLTSTKNWVGVRGWHGGALAFLAAAWLFERLGMGFGGLWPALLFEVSNNLFLVAITAMIAATLIKHRRNDSYRDNFIFLLILPTFLLGKHLLLAPETFALGAGITLGLFRVAFLVMLERTLPQFMKGNFQVSLLRQPWLDMPIKLLALLLVFTPLLPPAVWMPASGLLAALLLGRLAFWKPLVGAKRIEIGVMYFGYLSIAAGLLIRIAEELGIGAWVGSVAIHVFTFGAMGTIIPAMLIRISKGHTGRQVVFDRLDKWVLWVMVLAFALRIAAPQALPAAYLGWLDLAAACWFVSFACLAWRYVPYLMRARIDGKVH